MTDDLSSSDGDFLATFSAQRITCSASSSRRHTIGSVDTEHLQTASKSKDGGQSLAEPSNSQPVDTEGSLSPDKDDDSCANTPSSTSASCVTSSQAVGAMKVPATEKRVRHKNQDKSKMICAVCGDKNKVTGYHFGVITCESCKAFFRRHALKDVEPCVNDTNCKIDPINRKFCMDCRLKKCLAMGMRKDLIQDEEALAKRRKPVRRSSESAERGTSEGTKVRAASSSGTAQQTTAASSGTQPLTVDQKKEIDAILLAHERIDSPQATQVSENMESIKSSKKYCVDDTLFDQLTDQPRHAIELINMVHSFMVRFIKFLTSLPPYTELILQDKVAVLKNGVMETMAIRSALQYHADIGGYRVVNTTSDTQKRLQLEFIQSIFGEELYIEHMKFISTFSTAASGDKTAMILAMIINLFAADRSDIHNQDAVEKCALHYTELLQAYLHSQHPSAEAKAIYPRILMKLADVRDYGKMSSTAISNWGVMSTEGMEPLLQEIFSKACTLSPENCH